MATPEVQPYLDYIAYAYGVERDTIRLQPIVDDEGHDRGLVFAFQNMEQGQDKSHVHPWVIPLSRLVLPSTDASIPAEVRFARELRLVAQRMGIPTTAIRIMGDKFEVPHGDHSHTLKIVNTDGVQSYLDHQLPTIIPPYMAGPLDEAAVMTEIQRLTSKAQDKFVQDEVTLTRVMMGLLTIQERLVEKGNSTKGYLALLDAFDKRYIDQTEEASTESQPIAIQHDYLMSVINELNLTDYGVTKENLRQLANKAMEHDSETEMAEVTAYVGALRDANDRPGVEGMRYLYFFTQHLYDKELSSALRDQVATLIHNISTSTIIVGEEGDAAPLFAPSYHAKKAIEVAHESFKGIVDTAIGEGYKQLTSPDDDASISRYESMKAFAEEALDDNQKDDSLPTSDFREVAEEESQR